MSRGTTDPQDRRPHLWAGRKIGLAALLAMMVLGIVVLAPPALADDLAETEPEGALELAEKYSPIIMLKAQEGACDQDGEPYGPTSVDILLDNPEIVLRQVGPGDPVIMTGPGASDLFELGQGFHLDFPGSAVEPECIFETDFRKYSRSQPPVVYAHVVQQAGHPDQLAVQYWTYWYYNDWNNKHESDWEGIQVLFDASSIDEALASAPVSIGYAQHEGGEAADWDDSKLDREDTHPVVFSSAGSHASYFGSAMYLGRSGSEGFGCDNTDGPSDRIEPEVVLLPDSVDDPNSDLAWLAFSGRWGERRRGPFNGPTGPAAKSRWLEPIDWHEGLRDTSVIVPGGDTDATAIISAFCGVVDWGSGVLISFTTSPLELLITLAVVVAVASWLSRQTVWDRVEDTPLRRRRRAGQIIGLSGTAYLRAPRAFATFGLIYLPVAAVIALLGGLVANLPILGDLLDTAGSDSGTSFVLALLAGSVPHLIALVVVTAMMATYVDRVDADPSMTPVDAAKRAWAHRRALGSGLLRAAAIVFVLLITVVGAPWAIWSLVRYQFLPHAVMLEGLDGKHALKRSAELVRGRWWHTALMVALVNLVVGATALVVGLLLLVLFSGIPLWAFSAIVSLVVGFVVPVTALALTYLYGDAVAVEQDLEPAEHLAVAGR